METKFERYPLVTIVTPTYNQADYLAETIESVLNQSYPNIEYIVINDGSTDHTEQVLDRYRDRVICICQDNMGQSATLNKGWGISKGEYLSYLSSDDILYPNAIENLIEVINEKKYVCVFPDSNLIDIGGKVVKKNICKEFDLEKLVVDQECYIGPGAIFKKSSLEKHGGWDTSLKLAPDREFWIRISQDGEFYFLQKVLAGYRLHPRSISYSEVSESVSNEYLRVLDNYFSTFIVPASLKKRKNEAYAKAKLIVARNFLRSARFKKAFKAHREAIDYWPKILAPNYTWVLLRSVLGKPVRLLLGKIKRIVYRKN
ncbi:glycosyltransferase [Thiomicrospira sp.]|uniref:glycosyltransferase n=1 Tax=Thiomicrospira sp. TaxID=935 RepID=UPI002F940C17